MTPILFLTAMFAILDSTLVSSITWPTCTCSGFVNKAGFGNCNEVSKFKPLGSAVACFVKLPSSCFDLVESTTNPGMKISAKACEERKSKQINFNLDISVN